MGKKKINHAKLQGKPGWSGHAPKGHPVYGIKKVTKKEVIKKKMVEAAKVKATADALNALKDDFLIEYPDTLTFDELKEIQLQAIKATHSAEAAAVAAKELAQAHLDIQAELTKEQEAALDDLMERESALWA